MAAKPLQIVSGLPTEVEANTDSAGAGDAGKLVALGADGRIDESMMPTGIGADVAVIEASENLAAGDYVTIHNSTGAKVRKADASDGAAGQAHGFVKNNVTSGQNATVYFEGTNAGLSTLTPGATYVLSHSVPGGVVALGSASSTAGHILQVLGVATSATEINTEIAKPIVRG
jgi:hypothetical protein